LAEDAKVSIRNVRRDANKAIDLAEKDKLLSEDERDALKEQVQELTKDYENKVGDMAKTRESEVMEN
jgi:ribosome recycling factor